MGLLEELTGGIYGAAGNFGMDQQQQANLGLSAFQLNRARMAQQQMPHNPAMCNPMNWWPPRKHVESQEVTPKERARKTINGAVQAVKDAQEKAK